VAQVSNIARVVGVVCGALLSYYAEKPNFLGPSRPW
jgi:hypothetical protein